MTVVATPTASREASEAIEDEAQKHGVQAVETRLSTYPNSRRFSLVAGGEEISRITLTEVTRIDRAAIIIDDLGQNIRAARELASLRAPLTFSVMPGLRYSRETADEAHRAGIEVMLHLPMQPIDDSAPDVSPGEIKVGMTASEVDRIIERGLESVPYVSGVNNHMGSRATQDASLMREVMAELAARRLFYIDSRTIPDSVALATARRAGVQAFYRSVFLDDTRSIEYTRGQLDELCRVAEKQGIAIAIGHPYPSTIEALRQFLPDVARRGVEVVRVSELLRQPEVARLTPGGLPRSRSAATRSLHGF